ncbi:MAG: DUF1080 domain-containing protein [Planctomycetes bacterium]|nr:DUF1080 domain-containing protein [Planctomycetota bacterium]
MNTLRHNIALILIISIPALLAGGILHASAAQDHKVGYDDTPMLPDGKWRVHDSKRPRPPVITPGDASAAPSDAIVLFDGKELSKWSAANGDAKWAVENGVMTVNGTGDIHTKDAFGDCQLHVEWASPSKPEGDSQGRGNSGVYLMGRYEIQVLDSYQNETYADGQAAAMYGQLPPLVNACRKPGEWQVYDIIFNAPRFDGEKVTAPGRATVLHNGVVVHHADEFIGATAHRAVGKYVPHAAKEPLLLQDHGNPVRYRNIWIRNL